MSGEEREIMICVKFTEDRGTALKDDEEIIDDMIGDKLNEVFDGWYVVDEH